jgi:hypothetical protein
MTDVTGGRGGGGSKDRKKWTVSTVQWNYIQNSNVVRENANCYLTAYKLIPEYAHSNIGIVGYVFYSFCHKGRANGTRPNVIASQSRRSCHQSSWHQQIKEYCIEVQQMGAVQPLCHAQGQDDLGQNIL